MCGLVRDRTSLVDGVCPGVSQLNRLFIHHFKHTVHTLYLLYFRTKAWKRPSEKFQIWAKQRCNTPLAIDPDTEREFPHLLE
jgi:hypothetical protein